MKAAAAVRDTNRRDTPTYLRRSGWRARLVDAERGARLGFRTDSTFFVHLFVGSGIVAAAAVLGLDSIRWAIIVLAITCVLVAEMFNQMLRVLLNSAGHQMPHAWHDALKIGTAAVVLSSLGAGLVIVLVFLERLLA